MESGGVRMSVHSCKNTVSMWPLLVYAKWANGQFLVGKSGRDGILCGRTGIFGQKK